MTEREIEEFLALPLVGAIASLRSTGEPTVVPIWFRWTGSAITIWSDPAFGWVKRIRSEPRVAFTVFEHCSPSRAVYIRGTASVEEGTMGELDAEIRAITAKYVPAARLDDEIRSYDIGGTKVVITITPTSLRAATN
jgi:nitroimidazol reductase NimA-like FMN-containing flavoprotein (pyridoxamine 5'-phosphate oxidase superfamily)